MAESIIRFTKAHSNGNDFVIIDNREGKFTITPLLIGQMAHRRFGIGFDQMMVVEKPKTEHLVLKIFNQDGTPAMACGNGTICTASLMMTKLNQNEIVFDGPAGLLHAARRAPDNDENLLNCEISLAMGKVSFDWDEIPLAYECDSAKLPLHLEGNKTPFASTQCSDGIAVNIGNPHCVFFCDDAEKSDPENEGSYIEKHQLFTEQCNVEFVSINGDGSMRMRVWERGAGITLACGSGACASFAAAKQSGRITENYAKLHVDGGDMMISWNGNLENDIYITSKAQIVFQGSFPLPPAVPSPPTEAKDG